MAFWGIFGIFQKFLLLRRFTCCFSCFKQSTAGRPTYNCTNKFTICTYHDFDLLSIRPEILPIQPKLTEAAYEQLFLENLYVRIKYEILISDAQWPNYETSHEI